LEYREHEKLLSAFGEKTLAMINKKTGKLHPEFNQCSTATGRFSSDHPNIQQIPSKGLGSKLRRCFIASEGHQIVCADYSQIELRILAELSQEPKLIRAYNEGIDIHTQTASLAFGIPVNEVTSDHRKIAKILSFATVYGGGPTAISKGLLQVLDETSARRILKDVFNKTPSSKGAFYSLAKEFVDSYFREMPEASSWLESTGNKAIKLRYSETPLGRKRFYTHELDETKHGSKDDFKKALGSVRRKATNHPIQGCSADITKVAMNNLGQLFKEGGGRILIQVHDEIVCEVLTERLDEFVPRIERAMVAAGEEFLKSVPVIVDIKTSNYWKK
jgi:DNA polymerase-1